MINMIISISFRVLLNSNIFMIVLEIVLDLEDRIKSLNNSYILWTTSTLETQYYKAIKPGPNKVFFLATNIKRIFYLDISRLVCFNL